MIEIGKKTALLVANETKSGFTLQSDDGDEVFLPGSMAPKDLSTGQTLVVFVYTDTRGASATQKFLWRESPLLFES